MQVQPNPETKKYSTAIGQEQRLRIWDLPTRLFHWTLVFLVVFLVISGNIGGAMMSWHFRAGYGILILLIWRVLWGFSGGYWSRFKNFALRPKMLIAYLKDSTEFNRKHLGHNPLGSYSVVALLLILLLQVGSGLFSDDEISSRGPLASSVDSAISGFLTYYHTEIGKKILIFLIILHVLALLFYKIFKKINLVGAMIHGDKLVSDASMSYQQTKDDKKNRLIASFLVITILLLFLLIGWFLK